MITTVNSFSGGVGKTLFLANLGYQLGLAGRKVGILDSDIANPTLHIAFGMGDKPPKPTINDYLLGRCEILDAVLDVGEGLGLGPGKLAIVPSAHDANNIREVIRATYNQQHLYSGIATLRDERDLDYLLIDTKPGLDDKTLIVLGVTELLLILFRLEKADLLGTRLTLDLVGQLDLLPRTFLVPCIVDPSEDGNTARSEVETELGDPGPKSIGSLPESRALRTVARRAETLVTRHYPKDPYSIAVKQIAKRLDEAAL